MRESGHISIKLSLSYCILQNEIRQHQSKDHGLFVKERVRMPKIELKRASIHARRMAKRGA